MTDHIQKMIDGDIEKVAEAIMNLETLGGSWARKDALKKAGLVPNGDELLEALEAAYNWHVATVLPGMRIQEADIWEAEIGLPARRAILKAKQKA